MKYEQHPLSAAFPLMGEGDLMLMTQDIREHGLREPGVLFEGMILDGWHRYLACTKAKVDFLASEYTGHDPAGFVISKNAQRRHLKEGQRAVAVAACRKWAPAHRPNKEDTVSSLSEMAAEAGVSTKTMQRAKVVVAAGLGDAVRDEQMTVMEAVHVAKGTAPKPPKVEPSTSDESEMGEETDLLAMLEEMQKELDGLHKLNAKLTATDRGAELVKAHAAKEYAENEQGKAMNQAAHWQKECKSWQTWWAKVVAVLKIEKRSEVLDWIKSKA